MDWGAVREIFENTDWTFAKSTPHIPHFWSAKQDWEDPALFKECAQFIVDNGRLEQFRNFTPKRYLYVGVYRYWIMSDPVTATIINRCDPSHPALKPFIKSLPDT